MFLYLSYIHNTHTHTHIYIYIYLFCMFLDFCFHQSFRITEKNQKSAKILNSLVNDQQVKITKKICI